MKNLIVCFLALFISAISYAQKEQVKKEISTPQQKIELLSSEFELSTEQTAFLKEYFNPVDALEEKEGKLQTISKERRMMESKLVKLFPEALVTEIRHLNKKNTKKLTKRDIGM